MKRKWIKQVYFFMVLFGSVLTIFLMLSLNDNKDITIQNEEPVCELGTNKFYLPQITEEIMFCNEEVPLNITDVKEKLDNELIVNNYWHSQTFRLLKNINSLKTRKLQKFTRAKSISSFRFRESLLLRYFAHKLSHFDLKMFYRAFTYIKITKFDPYLE